MVRVVSTLNGWLKVQFLIVPFWKVRRRSKEILGEMLQATREGYVTNLYLKTLKFWVNESLNLYIPFNILHIYCRRVT
jgi:hypothetical protein